MSEDFVDEFATGNIKFDGSHTYLYLSKPHLFLSLLNDPAFCYALGKRYLQLLETFLISF